MTNEPKPTNPIPRKSYRTELTLPTPVSTNSLWRNSKGKVHKSAKYTRWLRDAGWELVAQKPLAIPSPVKIVMRAGLPFGGRKPDLDNLLKGLLDLLEAHRVIESDADVVDIALKWDRIIEPGRINVALNRTTPIEHRLDAKARAKVSVATSESFNAAFAALKERAAA